MIYIYTPMPTQRCMLPGTGEQAGAKMEQPTAEGEGASLACAATIALPRNFDVMRALPSARRLCKRMLLWG